MTSSRARLALLAHGLLMIVLPVALTLATFVGVQRGVGPSGWLQGDPMAAIGLVQAYLLMALVALLVCRRATADRELENRFTLIVAHLVPLVAVCCFWELLGANGFADLRRFSLAIHLPLIALELGLIVAALRRGALGPKECVHA